MVKRWSVEPSNVVQVYDQGPKLSVALCNESNYNDYIKQRETNHMTKFTKESVKALRSSMLKEMEEVAKKYGVEVSFGTIRFTDYEFGVKMTTRAKIAGVVVEAEADKFKPFTGKIQIGTRIQHPARKDALVVTKISDRGSVFVTASRGGKYRLKMEDAIKYAIA